MIGALCAEGYYGLRDVFGVTVLSGVCARWFGIP